MSRVRKHVADCPACGYELSFLPWDEGCPSDEICSCCGIQFGYDDIYADTEEDFKKVYADWRCEWIKGGYKWFSPNPPPAGWNPETQLHKYLSNEDKVLHTRNTNISHIKKDN